MGVVHNDENKNGDHRYPRGMNHGNESPESIAAQRIRAIFSVSIRLVRVIEPICTKCFQAIKIDRTIAK